MFFGYMYFSTNLFRSLFPQLFFISTINEIPHLPLTLGPTNQIKGDLVEILSASNNR